MEFMELIKDRYSVRSFSDKKVEKEKIDLILEAASVAPTAANLQPQKIYIINTKESLKKINELTPCIYNAQTVFLVCSDESLAWKSTVEDYSSGEMDATIVCTHMMLEAWTLGIGSTWVRLFDSNKIIEEFNLPENLKPVCLLPIGYPTEDCKPHPIWHETNKKISEFTEKL